MRYDAYRLIPNPSLKSVLQGMRHYAVLGAANSKIVTQRKAGLSAARVASMRSGAWGGTSDPKHGADRIRTLVEQICQGLQSGDQASEILAVYYWVCQNIRYMKDPYEVELVKEPIKILESRTADCDEIATLLAAMLMGCGNECRFVLASFSPDKVPSHVFVAVKTPNGFLTLDPVANRMTAPMFDKATSLTQIPCIPG